MSLLAHSNPALPFLLALTLKTTFLLTVTWIAASALRRQSAALRHQVWALGIIGALALPFLTTLLPVWHAGALGNAAVHIEMVSGAETTDVTQSPVVVSAAASGAPWSYRLITAALALWALGSLLVLVKLLAGAARLVGIAARSKPLSEEKWLRSLADLCKSFGIGRTVRMLECASPVAMPGTWGVLRPRIILPAGAAEWSEGRRRMVLSHELTHIRRHDWLLQICAELLRGLYWFHPLAWIAANKLRQESEHACDDFVLNSGIGAAEYASQLVALARALKSPERRLSIALAIARPSTLERRFAAMLNPSLNRKPLSQKAGALAILFGLCLLLPLAALSLSARPLAVQSQPAATIHEPSDEVAAYVAIVTANQKVSATSAHKIKSSNGGSATETAGNESGAVIPDAATTNQSAGTPNQATSNGEGTISGTIYDPSGAFIAGATITLANDRCCGFGGTKDQTTSSDAKGNFMFAAPADIYDVTVEATGFKKWVHTGVDLAVGNHLVVNSALEVGTISQMVTVESDVSQNAPTGPDPNPATPTTYSVCTTTPAQASAPASNGVGTPAQRLQEAAQQLQLANARAQRGVGGQVTAASLVNQATPIYPASARRARVQGTAIFHAILGKNGNVMSLCLVNGGQVDSRLAQAAFDAISQWSYNPTLLNGQPVEVETTITVKFMLGIIGG